MKRSMSHHMLHEAQNVSPHVLWNSTCLNTRSTKRKLSHHMLNEAQHVSPHVLWSVACFTTCSMRRKMSHHMFYETQHVSPHVPVSQTPWGGWRNEGSNGEWCTTSVTFFCYTAFQFCVWRLQSKWPPPPQMMMIFTSSSHSLRHHQTFGTTWRNISTIMRYK
jgi:hypothetical protein